MPTPASRRRFAKPVVAAPNPQTRGARRMSPLLKALGPDASNEPSVLVRLLLLTVDDASGEGA